MFVTESMFSIGNVVLLQCDVISFRDWCDGFRKRLCGDWEKKDHTLCNQQYENKEK
jgi:hypothetical protein